MASTEKKYQKLKKEYNTSHDSTQLIFPMDLAMMDGTPGTAVIFEPNVIKGHHVQSKQKLKKPKNTVSGAYGSEVAMQNENVAKGSIRSSESGLTNNGGKLYTKTEERIVLPMPAALSATYAVNWQTTELGVIGRGLDFVKGVKDMDSRVLTEMLPDAAARTAAGAVQSMGIANVKDYIELKTGTSPNPYTEVLFKGVNNRMIPFSWTLVPRNAEEAKIIRSIVQRLKYHMLPEYKYTEGGGDNTSYLLAPSTFDITFFDFQIGGRNPWLWKMSTCALTNVQVNGSPNGEVAIMKDGALQAVNLELMFTELTTLTKDNMLSPEDCF